MCNCNCDDDEPCKCNPFVVFKLNQTVYSLVYGEGIVISVGAGIIVNHKTKQILYNLDGRLKAIIDSEIVLFHAKPTIIPPKPKVKKYRWVYQIQGGDAKISDHFSEQGWRGYKKSIGSIKLPWTEIEE